ncbi:MAG: DNA mismatch repair protein MutS [Polaromonas sp.]|nr:MAG: DNA mismatch repair protein MutS [Polaromonas sp.]
MRPAKDPNPKPDLAPALRQALEAVLKRAPPAAAAPGVAAPALTRAQRRPIRQPDLRTAPPRVNPRTSVTKTLKSGVKTAAKNVVAAKPSGARKAAESAKPASTKAPQKAPQKQRPPPVKTLQDLQTVKREIDTRARLTAERDRAKAALEARTRADKELFSRTVGVVKALPPKHRPGHRVELPPVQAPPIAVQHKRDEVAVMQEALSDGFDAETLLDTDDALSFRRAGIGTDVTRKLRKGDWSIQGQVDLHGLRREDARQALVDFIKDATRMGWRCVRVVHGKGLGSPGKTPVLKGKVQSWLVQKQEVLAFVQARPAHGGAGALVVLLTQS